MSLRKPMAALASVVLLSAVMVGALESPASASGCLTIDSNDVVTDGKTCTGDVVVPESVTGIGRDAFRDSTLTSITIPAKVTVIDDDAFQNTSLLRSVTFAGVSQLSSIGDGSFFTSGLRSITIPASVTSIGFAAFAGTTSLTSVTFDGVSQLSSIGSFTFLNSGVTSITIPASVTSIGGMAFARTTSLTSVTFDGVSQLSSIVEFAFDDSRLTSITIPASVTSIGTAAFRNNILLSSVTFAGNAPTVGISVFTNVAAGAAANVGFAATGFEPDVSGLWEGLVLVRAAAPPEPEPQPARASTTTPGVGGIFLHIAGSQGRLVEGTPVYHGSVGVAPNTSYTLSVQRMGARALTRTVLASGVTNGDGHREGRIQLGGLAPGSYKIVMTGTHRLGHPLVLTNHIRVDAGGKFVSVSPESVQPTLR